MSRAARKRAALIAQVAIDNLMEIVPVSNPVAITQNDPVTLELRYKGKPFSNQVVSVIPRLKGAASAQDLMTDERGV